LYFGGSAEIVSSFQFFQWWSITDQEKMKKLLCKKPHFALGTELTIPAEGSMRRARVVELPLPEIK